MGAKTNRMRAKTEITALAWSAETSNVFAKIGSAGAKIPNPIATQKAMAESTATSRGSPLNSGVRLIAPPSFRVREVP